MARRAGITKRVGPFHHAFITAALDAGVPLRDVQEAASHADPRTTMRYDRGARIARQPRHLHRGQVPRRRQPLTPPDRRVLGEAEGVDGSQRRQVPRADVAHNKLVTSGYAGSERTTGRAVAAARKAWAA
jgi:hypothetical protein